MDIKDIISALDTVDEVKFAPSNSAPGQIVVTVRHGKFVTCRLFHPDILIELDQEDAMDGVLSEMLAANTAKVASGRIC